MRLVLFLAVWGGGVVRGEVDAAGHACGEQFVTWPQSQLERVLSAGCSAFHLLTGGGGLRPGLYPSARCRCSSGPHVEQRWSLVPRGCVPVPASSHSWAQLAVCWESWGWAGLRPSVWDAVVGSGYWSLSALPFLPSVSTGKDQCTTCSSAASPLCFMANTQPDLFRVDLSFFGQLHTFFFFKYVLYNWQ